MKKFNAKIKERANKKKKIGGVHSKCGFSFFPISYYYVDEVIFAKIRLRNILLSLFDDFVISLLASCSPYQKVFQIKWRIVRKMFHWVPSSFR